VPPYRSRTQAAETAGFARLGADGEMGGGFRFTAQALTAARAFSAVAAAGFAALLWYTIEVDGSPFRSSLLTPWMNTTLVDFYLNWLVIAAWQCTREPLPLAVFFVVFTACLGSCATWLYALYVLSQVRAGDSLAVVWLGTAYRR